MPVHSSVVDHVMTIAVERTGESEDAGAAVRRALSAELIVFDRDPELRVAVLRSADEDGLPMGAEQPSSRASLPSVATLRSTYRPGKPVVAALVGSCSGAALVVVGHVSDVRIAGVSARFGFGDIERGIGGGSAVGSRLHRQIPYTALMWMVLGGELDAQEALRVGLVNEVVPDHEVNARAAEMARSLVTIAPLASLAEKLSLQISDGMLQADAAFYAAGVGLINRLHPDVAEGIAAFNEKRAPRYRGAAREVR